MRLPLDLPSGHRDGNPSARKRRRQEGFSLIIVILFLALVTALVVSNGGALRHLGRQLAIVEKRQCRRLEKKVQPIPSTPPHAKTSLEHGK